MPASDGPVSLVDFDEEAPGANCTRGGIAISRVSTPIAMDNSMIWKSLKPHLCNQPTEDEAHVLGAVRTPSALRVKPPMATAGAYPKALTPLFTFAAP